MSKLFHYTSINNLALILKSGSIRFGRLDKVNDPTEGLTGDTEPFSQYIFVSCWTSNPNEDLALWNMYTPQMRGVRIELSLPIFDSYAIGSNPDFMIPEHEYVNETKGYFVLGANNKPENIEYTDDREKLIPNVKVEQGFKIDRLGLAKRTIWKIEQESRYRMQIFPFDPAIQSRHFPDKYANMLVKRIPPPIDGYLVKIGQNSFRSMKIRLSPKLINGDLEIIEALKHHFNPDAIIENSTLEGLVR